MTPCTHAVTHDTTLVVVCRAYRHGSAQSADMCRYVTFSPATNRRLPSAGGRTGSRDRHELRQQPPDAPPAVSKGWPRRIRRLRVMPAKVEKPPARSYGLGMVLKE
jgi:hypothetical protein